MRLAEKFLARRDTITVSGVGAAVATAATVGEILKSRSLATVTRVRTGTVTRVDERDPDERVGKATLELELRRSERFHIRAEAAANAAANADDGREVIVENRPRETRRERGVGDDARVGLARDARAPTPLTTTRKT